MVLMLVSACLWADPSSHQDEMPGVDFLCAVIS